MPTNRKKMTFGAGARGITTRSRRLSPRSRARTGIGAGKRPYNYNKRVVSLPKKITFCLIILPETALICAFASTIL